MRVARSMRATVPVAAMPRLSTTTRSAVGSVPVGSVGSPSFGQRPPQWLTQAVEPSRLIAAPNGATPPVFTRPSSRPDAASTIASSFSNTSGTTARRAVRASAGPPARWRPRSSASAVNAPRRVDPVPGSGARGVREQPDRAAGAVVRRARRDDQADQRRSALGIEGQPLQRRRALQLPAAADRVLQPVEAIELALPARVRPVSTHSSLADDAERDAVDAAVEHALDAGRRDRLARRHHAGIGHAAHGPLDRLRRPRPRPVRPRRAAPR